ncbi:MAG: outer membrane protein [Sphingomonadaceae bacterium]
MKSTHFLIAAALLAVPNVASAEESGRNPLSGVKVGVEATRDSNRVRQAGGTLDANRNGFGVRGFAGYDAAIGSLVVVGAELGIGTGGKTTDQAALLAGGRYRVDPGFTYDATARLGFAPAKGFMIYGRSGYRWLRTRRTVAGQATGNGVSRVTEKGFTYGGGVEAAITENFALRAEFNRTNFDRNFKQNKVSVGASLRF